MARKPEHELSLQFLTERATAFHETILYLNETYPNFSMMTYDHVEPMAMAPLHLLKCVTGIEGIGPLLYDDCTDDSRSDNLPGMLKGVYPTQTGDAVTVEIAPLLTGRREVKQQGGMIVRVTTRSGRDPYVRFFGGGRAYMHFSPSPDVCGDDFKTEFAKASLKEGTVVLKRTDRDMMCVVCGEGIAEDGDVFTIRGRNGTLTFAAAYSADENTALSLAACPVDLAPTQTYYADLTSQSAIRTPDKELDEAFTHAVLNMEYAWVKPIGWIESFQHWQTFWHMEQIAFANWLGQGDRSRDCLLTLTRNLFDNAAVPDMNPGGSRRRDWGGNNQFYLRELCHYVDMTGDLSILEEAEPHLDAIMTQTLQEYDPAGTGVIGWGTQIGNQEDMESTPGPGGATGIEGVQMLREMAHLKSLCGKEEDARQYALRAQIMLDAWRAKILRQGLPIWHRDTTDMSRLDPTYHGLCYPVLYDCVSDEEKAHFMDHLLHRLAGEEGEIYQSDHFGSHDFMGVPTWGMQCGSDMQPFAAMALAKCGMGDEAVRPLRFVAHRVCGDYQRGSFQETANETRLAYFSPSAGVYGQGVIEGIFGMRIRGGVFELAPAFPNGWNDAHIHLPGIAVDYHRNGNTYALSFLSPKENTRFMWKSAPFSACRVKVDGMDAAPQIEGRCGYFDVCLDVHGKGQHRIELEIEPLALDVQWTKRVCEGGDVKIRVSGAELLSVSDLSETAVSRMSMRNGCAVVTMNPHTTQEEAGYGWFGRIQFARRCLCLRLRRDDTEFSFLCPVTVMPAWRIASRNGQLLRFGKAAEKNGVVQVGGRFYPVAESFPTDRLLPGKNDAELLLEDGTVYPFLAEMDAPNVAIRPIDVPKDRLVPGSEWEKLGKHPHHGAILIWSDNFMKGLFEDMPEIAFPGIQPFRLWKEGFLPLSRDAYPLQKIDLSGIQARKIYLVMCGFLNNQDMFSTPFRVELEAEKGDSFIRPRVVKMLRLPGDLDFGYGVNAMAGFHSFENGTARGADYLPPMGEDGDYPCTKGPDYPQRELWCGNRAFETHNVVFNLIELDLGKTMPLTSLSIFSLSADAAGGVFALGAL